MARPTITTPVETTIMVLRSTSDWSAKYADELETIFGEDYDAESLANQMAERLEEHEETYVREQREDVGLTNQRKDAVQQTQRLVSSAVASEALQGCALGWTAAAHRRSSKPARSAACQAASGRRARALARRGARKTLSRSPIDDARRAPLPDERSR